MMDAIINHLSNIGQASLNFFWFPMLIWTALILLVYVCLRIFKNISPLYQYHIRTAILAALPAGLISWSLMNWILTADAIRATSAKIIVFINPVTIQSKAIPAKTGFTFGSPDIWLGIILTLLLIFAIWQLIRFIYLFRELHLFRRSLNLVRLKDHHLLSDGNRKVLQQISATVYIGISQEPQIPSTFGWRKPVIVVPDFIVINPVKLNLVIRHELIHIRQYDYLVNIGVQLVKRIFRFHPLVGVLAQEIHEYSEITCDDEVLSDDSIPPKHYANLLFDMLQLPVLNQKNMIHMANPASNIKKRIQAMNITRRKNKSVGISVSLFSFILIGISLIMALSGLKDHNALGQTAFGRKMKITNPTIIINKQPLTLPGNNRNLILNGSLSGIFFIKTSNSGTFLVSGKSFDAAWQKGKINGKALDFTVNKMHVRIESSEPILTSASQTSVWVKHLTNNGLETLHVVGYGSREQTGSLITQYINSKELGFQVKHSEKTQHVKKIKVYPLAMLGFADSYKDYQENNFPDALSYTSGNNGQIVYNFAQKMPNLIGGMTAVMKQIRYPELARKEGIQGRVYVQFIVDKQGKVTNPKVIDGIGGGCDQEAVRVVKQAKFKPAILNGKPVNMIYSLPIVFKLNN